MKLYFGKRSQWSADLMMSIVEFAPSEYFVRDASEGSTIYNFRQAVNMAADAILRREGRRNYRFTIESYFHAMCRKRPDPDEQFCGWGQYVLKLRVPFPNATIFASLSAEELLGERCMTLDLTATGKWRTWEQDFLVSWLHTWNADVLNLLLRVGDRDFSVGEYLAVLLFQATGDLAGRDATLDELVDRGVRWRL